MLSTSLAHVAAWTEGRLLGADRTLATVTTDSRKVAGGELFVALSGPHHDGHDHVAAAAAAGASAALVSRPLEVALPQILVADTLRALGVLAAAVRARHAARVIGITGSNGKTTVKTLVAAILSQQASTHVNSGNFNNEIGLPLTLLDMSGDSEYAVLEMGAGKPGDIAYLADIAKPEIGLVNTVAPAHIEGMGSLAGIAETKGALYSALPDTGTAIVNADGDFADYFTGLIGTRHCVRFGLEQPADVSATETRLDATASDFTLHTPQGSTAVHLPLPGRHNVANALAAASVASAVDIPLAVIAHGLASATPVAGRLTRLAMTGGGQLIDDSYNANPGSVQAAIDTLLLAPGEHWLVLGDMAELGADAAHQHAELGRQARQRGVERLFTCGRMAQATARAFGTNAQHFDDQAALIEALRAQAREGVICLVKGSHAAGMTRVVAALTESEARHAT